MKAKGRAKKVAEARARSKVAKRPAKQAAKTREGREAREGAGCRKRKSASKAPALPHLRERWPRNERERKARAAEYYRRLSATYPDAHCALDHENPYQLLVATILSAQCTDKRVNMVTPELFKHYPDARALADAKPEELERCDQEHGLLPQQDEEPARDGARGRRAPRRQRFPTRWRSSPSCPGVGRKTANVVLGNAFDKNVGIVVDTHVTRLVEPARSHARDRCGEDRGGPDAALSAEQWTMLSHLLIEHGRQICIARAPRCEVCPLNDICPSSRV